MDTYEIVRNAIINKMQITAYYKGFYREMCPHVIGRKEGVEQALFYQFDGESKSGLEPVGSPNNWRYVFIDELTDVNSQEGEWFTAPNHTRPQTCVDEIDIEVEY